MLQLYPGDGCGNRFLIVREADALAAGEAPVSLAQRLCGRTYDGLLVLGTHASGRLAVQILNPDGTDGGACLNGLRVAACFTDANHGQLEMSERLVSWRRHADDFELHLPNANADLQVEVFSLPDGREGFDVAFWNPHAVFALDAVAQSTSLRDFDLKSFAAKVRCNTSRFPCGVNVEVVEGLGMRDEMQMRVFERGVGETAACGSGALAVAKAAWEAGAGPRIGIEMTGGRLEVERSEDGSIRLRGAARTGPAQDLAELLRRECKTFQ